jgi:hypothetical protein
MKHYGAAVVIAQAYIVVITPVMLIGKRKDVFRHPKLTTRFVI